MNLKAVLFDFDGTLVDTNQVIMNSWYATFDGMGVPRPSDEVILKTFGEPLVRSLENFFPGKVDETIVIYRHYQETHYKEFLAIYDGIKELLETLKGMGLRLAIVTSRLPHSTVEYMSLFDIQDYFEVLVTCADTDKHKPEPEPCLLALEKLGIKAEDAIMIGDSRFDILCAQNAGVPGVFVNWSQAADRSDLGCKPDYIIDKPMDLIDIIRG